MHKSKRDSTGDSSTDESEGQTSIDSGIELSRQLLKDEESCDSNGDNLLAPNSSLAVMDSDIDSDADGTLITSDTELLINERQETRTTEHGRMLKIRRWSASWSPNMVASRARNKAGQCSMCCGACVTSCINCTPKQFALFTVTKLKLLLHKLVEVARLMTDRKVILSASIYGVYGALHVMANEVTYTIISTLFYC